MTKAQVVDIAAMVLFEYPQPLIIDDAVRAAERIVALVNAHRDYDAEHDHIAIVVDGTRLDVRLLATPQDLMAYCGVWASSRT